MKVKLLLLLLIGLHAPDVSAQWKFFRQGSSAEKARGRPVAAGNYLFVNCAGMEAPDAGASYIYRYDSAGNKQQFVYDKYIWTMQATSDQKLIAVTQERRCSWRLDTLAYFFEKIGTDGSLLASATLTNGAAEIIQVPDSGYLVFLWDNKTLVRFDKSLNVVSTITHTYGNVQGSMLCQNGQIAIAHLGNAGQKLSLINSAGQQLSAKTITFSPTLVRPKGSTRITAYASNVFYEFDYSLNLQASFTVKHLFDYFVKNDSVYAIIRDSLGSNIVYGVYNSAMHVIYKTAISNYIPVSIGGIKNSVAVLFEPDIISFGRVNHCVAIRPKLGAFNAEKSMSLNYIGIDSAYYELRSDGFYDVYAKLNYSMSNWGPPVNKFTISVERSPDKTCGKYYSWQDFDEALPQIGNFSAQSDGFLQTQSSMYNGVLTVTYCAVISQADGEFDATPQNNVYCIYPYFDLVGLQERSASAAHVVVFPNPFEEKVTLVSEQEMELAQIISMQGQLVQSIDLSGDRKTLDLSLLPSGIYMLKVKTAGGTAVKRIVAH